MSWIKVNTLVILAILVIVWGCVGLLNRRAEIPQIEGAHYVGTQKCIEEKCHPKRMEDIVASRHAPLFKQDTPDKPACELCHGKGSLHIEATDDPDLILIYREMSPKPASEVCLTCHATGAIDKWHNSAHYRAGVSCNECHLYHGSGDKQLLKAPDPEICYKCHAEEQQKFTLASTHRFKEQGFRCLNCHASHEQYDTLGKHNVRLKICLECHEEYRVPAEYEHAPVKKNCIACHAAHGSEYPKLCRADIKTLCESCHSVIHRTFLLNRSFTDAEKKLNSGKCTACHKKVHGSKYQFLLKRKPPKIGPARMGPPSGFTPPAGGGGSAETMPQRGGE